jgi:hypothetical protein
LASPPDGASLWRERALALWFILFGAPPLLTIIHR